MEIEEKIKEIIITKLNRKKELLIGNENESLTGDIIRFSPMDMVYFYFFVVEEFGKCFNENDLLEAKFNTIAGIVECIGKYNRMNG